MKRNGGSDPLNAPGKRVRIFGDKGEVLGVFGWPAIHVRKEGKEEMPRVTNLFVDVGATSAREVREMGQVITGIGVAVVKPAEFVIFRISQSAGASA